MPYLPLCVLEGFPKNLPQHLIWRGNCTRMTPLIAKSEGSLRIIVLSNQHLHPPRAYTCYYEEVASVPSGVHKNAPTAIFKGHFFTPRGCKIFP